MIKIFNFVGWFRHDYGIANYENSAIGLAGATNLKIYEITNITEKINKFLTLTVKVYHLS